MRLIYFDEAGRASSQQEPYFVVAGVIVEPDKQWRRLEEYYREMAADLFPGYDPYRFIFHAHQVWHGTGPFDKRKWPLKERMKILQRLVQVPQLFELRIVIGAVEREGVREELLQINPKAKGRDVINHCHLVAFIDAIRKADYWLRRNAPDECAMVIAEDTDGVKSMLKDFHNGYTDQRLCPEDVFRTDQIIDSLHFAKKQEAVLLQIADHCAFVAKRRLMEMPHIDEFYIAIAPQLSQEPTPAKRFRVRIPARHLEPNKRSVETER